MFRSAIFLFIVSCCSLSAATHYLINDMGMWDLGDSRPTGLNDRGEVVGMVQGDSARKVFIWDREKGHRIIKKIPDGAYPVQINNKGQVIGHFYSWDGFFTRRQVLHAFIWSEDDGFEDIGPVDGKDTAAVCINDKGQVVLITTENQCYLWEDGDEEKLEDASNVIQSGELNVVCGRINNKEFIFVKKDANDKKSPAALYRMNLKTKELKREMDHKKGVPYMTCFNEEGLIAGFFSVQGNAECFVLKNDGTMTTVSHFRPFSMNILGTMVGQMRTDLGEVGGFYQDGKLQDISNLLLSAERQPFAFERITALRVINKEGWIIGIADAWNKKQAVVLIPQEID